MSDLTICILVYNAEQYLKDTLDSLEKQDADYEYLIILDGSIDRSKEICLEFKNRTQRTCTIHCFDENHGTAYCRDWAIRNAKTKYFMFFDSDDIAKPELVRTLYSTIQADDDCISVSCQARYIDEQGNKLHGGMYFQIPDAQTFRERAAGGKFLFMLPPTIFKREYALKAGGYRQSGFPEGKIRYQDLSEDLDLWSRMSDFYKEGKYMIIVPQTLYYYRKRTGSLSETKDRQYAMSLKMKYIKCNLKRRRAGESEITFLDFLASRTKWEILQEKRRFYSEYFYRKAAFAFAEHRYLKAVVSLPVSVVLNPNYLIQKIRANIGNK